MVKPRGSQENSNALDSPFSDLAADFDNSSILQSPTEDQFNRHNFNHHSNGNNHNIDDALSDTSAPATPQLNTDRFEGGRSSSLRFQLPRESSSFPTPPASSSSSSNSNSAQHLHSNPNKSPFLDQNNTILEDEVFENQKP